MAGDADREWGSPVTSACAGTDPRPLTMAAKIGGFGVRQRSEVGKSFGPPVSADPTLSTSFTNTRSASTAAPRDMRQTTACLQVPLNAQAGKCQAVAAAVLRSEEGRVWKE